MKTCFVTNCYFVNLREVPNSNSSSTIITDLPYGHECTSIDESGEWWYVKTEKEDVRIQGYIKSDYLTHEQYNIGVFEGITAVHFRENQNYIKPTYDGNRANPIGDSNRPGRDMSSNSSKVNSIHEILNYLDVEDSVRYQRKGSKTYCNVYAYDFCYLCNVYLPRVWWKGPALIQLSNGESVEVSYNNTIVEMRANDLFHWFKDFGSTFGWSRVFDPQDLQNNSDNGGIGIIVANTKDQGDPGHICVVVPQTETHKPVMLEGKVKSPVTSQAGGRNYKYRAYNWWSRDYYSFFGFFIHE